MVACNRPSYTNAGNTCVGNINIILIVEYTCATVSYTTQCGGTSVLWN